MKISKKYIYFFVFFSFFWVLFFVVRISNAGQSETENMDCEYTSQLEQCIAANKNGNPRSIEDFECLASTDSEEILMQIILDDKFKEVQKRGIEYLDKMEKDAQAASTDPMLVVDENINYFGKEGILSKEFSKLCKQDILAARLECTGGKAPNVSVSNFLTNVSQSNECMQLADQYLQIANSVAERIVKKNRSLAGSSDPHQEYNGELRTKYEEVMKLLRQILWDIERINPTHITTNPK